MKPRKGWTPDGTSLDPTHTWDETQRDAGQVLKDGIDTKIIKIDLRQAGVFGFTPGRLIRSRDPSLGPEEIMVRADDRDYRIAFASYYVDTGKLELRPTDWALWPDPFVLRMRRLRDVDIVLGRDTVQWVRSHTNMSPFGLGA